MERNDEPMGGRSVNEPAGLSRRGIFAAMIGSVAAMLFSGLRPKAAEGATVTSLPVRIGDNNNAGTQETVLRSQVPGDKATLAILNEIAGTPGNPPPDGLRVFTSGTGGGAAIQAFGGPGTFSRAPRSGIGVRGIGAWTGIIGVSTAASGPDYPAFDSPSGISGQGTLGVKGESTHRTGAGLFGKGYHGVKGLAKDENSYGVWGETASFEAKGTGVGGHAPRGTGVWSRGLIGVHATSSSQTGDDVAVLAEGATALRANGRVQFSSAGLATIAANTRSVTVTPGIAVSATAKVLCTLQSDGGVLQNVIKNPANNTFTINLTANATAPVTVAWFVIS